MVQVSASLTIDGEQREMVVKSRNSNSYPFAVELRKDVFGPLCTIIASEVCRKKNIEQKIRGIVNRELNEEDEIEETLEQTLDKLSSTHNRVER